jgi:HSP20 family protein
MRPRVTPSLDANGGGIVKQSAAAERAETPALRLIRPDEMFDHMKDTFDAIARRAFAIFDGNGRRLGHALDDWLRAEAELLHPVHLDISETEKALTVRAEVPGFSEKDIEVSVEPRRLTISGKRESTEEKKTKGKVVYSEHCSNQLFRVVELPAEVDAASPAVKATCDRGILTISMPRAKTRQIEVEAHPA